MAIKYAQSGWLLIDILSVFPFDLLLLFADLGTGEGESNKPTSMVRLVRGVRLLRLLKLFRILHASRIIRKFESHVSISYAKRGLALWIVAQLVLFHWFSCAWIMEAIITGSQRAPNGHLAALLAERMDAELARAHTGSSSSRPALSCTGCLEHLDLPSAPLLLRARPDLLAAMSAYCLDDCLTTCEIQLLAEQLVAPDPWVEHGADVHTHLAASPQVAFERVLNRESWTCRAEREGLLDRTSALDLYTYPLYRFGLVSPTTSTERLFYFALSFLSLIVTSLFVGALSGAAATGDPHETAFRNRMDEFNNFFEDVSVPVSLRRKIRELVPGRT